MLHYFLTLLAIVATMFVVLFVGLPILIFIYWYKYQRKGKRKNY